MRKSKKVYLTAKEMGEMVRAGKDLPVSIFSATKTDYIVKSRSIYGPKVKTRKRVKW